MGLPDRSIAALGALSGAAGVMLLAAGAHVDASGNFTTAGWMLLVHAGPVVYLAAGGLLRRGPRLVTALALLAGGLLFSGDLAVRARFGVPLFPMAARPAGYC
ncbi:DUF423 domain-containing protein [Methylobrevis pamukkalensis]|uniref:YhhN-like protein n=1 Tax=Methylobrevis pamukkalensis TaxID=1439726 RepID=A0A1E3GZ22_9HYPH|nr:DUF423 domain-containing protein [Methylobrevis pamukkalensis]ODN69318.1 hypothetical protein A6302_03373 [Methylobrevis pamukkalensis]